MMTHETTEIHHIITLDSIALCAESPSCVPT